MHPGVPEIVERVGMVLKPPAQRLGLMIALAENEVVETNDQVAVSHMAAETWEAPAWGFEEDQSGKE